MEPRTWEEMSCTLFEYLIFFVMHACALRHNEGRVGSWARFLIFYFVFPDLLLDGAW